MAAAGRTRPSRVAAIAAAALALAGCIDAEAVFTSGRLREPCNGSWPVCTTTAGCVVGNAYFLDGRFPGTRRMIIKTESRATVAIVVTLRSEGATGEETRFLWNETGCGTAFTVTVDGRDFFKEFDALGEFRRSKDLARPGDHLIEVSSDATADYLLKLEVDQPDLM